LRSLDQLGLAAAQRGDVAYEEGAIRQTIALIRVEPAVQVTSP
jgi:hypothetical protein